MDKQKLILKTVVYAPYPSKAYSTKEKHHQYSNQIFYISENQYCGNKQALISYGFEVFLICNNNIKYYYIYH